MGGALLGSLALHLLAVAAFWLSGLTYASPLPPMKSYRVNIISPPPVEAGPAQTPVTPEPEPPRPEAKEEPVVEQKPEPVVETKPELPAPTPQPKPAPPKQEPKPEPKPTESKPEEVKEEEKKPAAKPAPRPATGAKPKPDAPKSGSGLNIQIDGDLFPFPGYLENIAEQIGRYFRWTGDTGLRAEIYFEIMRDGSVQGIRLLTGSGSAAFNFEAMGAIEQAGNRRAFGPLPEGYTEDRLPVSFYFQPAR
jgi:outer membrane biosynthesis protein TonB